MFRVRLIEAHDLTLRKRPDLEPASQGLPHQRVDAMAILLL
jgi:hypothetical protein